jgi:hypothetical protein
MTAAKFKRLIFSVSGFPLSNVATIDKPVLAAPADVTWFANGPPRALIQSLGLFLLSDGFLIFVWNDG